MLKVTVAGHICADLTPELPAGIGIVPGQLTNVGPLIIRPGGCVVNTGGDLAALGVDVTTSGVLGSDELGRIVLDHLDRHGIGTANIEVSTNAATSYSVVIEPPGMNRTFWHHVGANALFDGTSVSVNDTDLLHIGYPPLLPALLPDSGAALAALLRRARTADMTTSLDMAVVDANSPAGRADWHGLLKRILPLVDVFSPSLEDLRSSLGVQSIVDRDGLQRLARSLIDDGAAVVMISAGEDGVALCTAGAERFAHGGRVLADLTAQWCDVDLWMPALPVEQIKTTNGAGDAASAGLLYGLVAGCSAPQAARLAITVAAAKIQGDPIANLSLANPNVV